MTRKRGKHSVILTGIIIFTSVSLILGWTWHSLPGYDVEPGIHVVEKAFYAKQSGLMVEVNGQVVRLMERDRYNPRHQEFQIRLPNGQLLQVVHQNGGKEWIPLAARDDVTVRGDYQWSELGGVIRGTQRDNSLERRHGWIEHKGKKYQ